MSVISAPAEYMRAQAPARIQGLMGSPFGVAGLNFAQFEYRPITPPLRGSRQGKDKVRSRAGGGCW